MFPFLQQVSDSVIPLVSFDPAIYEVNLSFIAFTVISTTTENHQNKELRCKDLIVAYFIQQIGPSLKAVLTNSNILLCKRNRAVAGIKEEKTCIWIHPQELCNLDVHKDTATTYSQHQSMHKLKAATKEC